MLLIEATFDDIFRELRNRFPDGLVVAGLRPGDDAEAGDEPHVTIAHYNIFASIALADIASVKFKGAVCSGFTHRELEEPVDGEGEDEE